MTSDVTADAWQKPYAEAGHDVASLFAPGSSYNCARCGAAQIDLSEDLAYGEMRKCSTQPPPIEAGLVERLRHQIKVAWDAHTPPDVAMAYLLSDAVQAITALSAHRAEPTPAMIEAGAARLKKVTTSYLSQPALEEEVTAIYQAMTKEAG